MSGSRRGTLQAPTTSKPDPGGTTGPSRTTGTRSQSTSRGNAASAAGADGQRIEGCSFRAGRLLFQKRSTSADPGRKDVSAGHRSWDRTAFPVTPMVTAAHHSRDGRRSVLAVRGRDSEPAWADPDRSRYP